MRCLLAALCGLLVACEPGAQAPPAPPAPEDFANPQRVTITGYVGDAMEPFVSPDGRLLFFNNLNDPSVDTNLHWAERVDELTYRYLGELAGANSKQLDGVASLDREGTFFFVSTRSYAETASTLYRGRFAAGEVSGVELVPGVSTSTPGIVNFDAEISRDGSTLYFVEGRFAAGSPVPASADILIATRDGNRFTRTAEGAVILRAVNSLDALEYAPAISASGLELVFTRLAGSDAALYAATRLSTSSSFGPPRRIAAITGFAEGPTFSPDEKSLYYHQRDAVQFVLYRVSRP
jgi:Tol biopolymer transport system component